MMCLYCAEETLRDLATCLGCISRASSVEARAVKYAVAAILYYREGGEQMITDAEFDGLRLWLIEQRAENAVSWLTREMLRPSGRHDLTAYPKWLHYRADDWVERWPARFVRTEHNGRRE